MKSGKLDLFYNSTRCAGGSQGVFGFNSKTDGQADLTYIINSKFLKLFPAKILWKHTERQYGEKHVRHRFQYFLDFPLFVWLNKN